MKARIPNQQPRQSQAQMMAQIQAMQDEMKKKQEEVENTDFSSSAGGGAVEITVSGKHEVKSVKISREVVDPDDVEMLEDMVTAAFNEAVRKADEAMENAVNSATGGINIPGLDGLI